MVTNALLACSAGCDLNNAPKQDAPSAPVHRPDASTFFVASKSDWDVMPVAYVKCARAHFTLSGSVLGKLHLRWWAPEPSGQVREVEHATGQPDNPEQLGLAVEMQQEVQVDDGADRREDDVWHEPL
jgi:hypothetical protein